MNEHTRATRHDFDFTRAWQRCLATLCTVFSLMSCAPSLEPPPEDYDSLLRYLFANMMAENTTELSEGLNQLDALLADSEVRSRGAQGHSLASLTDVAVNALDDKTRSADDLMGLGVVTESPHRPEDIACTLVWEDFGEIVEENFDSYDRQFEASTSCFCDQSCDMALAASETQSNWGGLIQMAAAYRIQFRWVDAETGPVLLHRFWLLEPAGEPGGVTMESNYYLGVTFVSTSGTTTRVHASWFSVDLGTLDGAEDLVFGSTIDNVRNDAERIDNWISENGVPGRDG